MKRKSQYVAARKVAHVLTRAGYLVYFAGGCVRDSLLQRKVADIDIATSAAPDTVERLFEGRTVSVGKSFGVVIVREGKFSFDVATFRTDGTYADGRHPDSVAFATPEGDAQRRDFTINALFQDPDTDKIIDYVNGKKDLAARVIRAIGDPVSRFAEDHLRMLRAVRFASVLGFQIEEKTLKAICEHAEWITTVSVERIAKEVTRMLCESPAPSVGLNLLLSTGILHHILPEAVAMKGVEQPPQFHPEGDVWTHTCLMLDSAPFPRSPALAWSLLLHDIGKPSTHTATPDPGTDVPHHRFMNHACVGAVMAEEILRRLHFSNELTMIVRQTVAAHMSLFQVKEMRQSSLRRYMSTPWFTILLEVLHLDLLHSNGDLTAWKILKDYYDSFLAEPVILEPIVHGRNLIEWGYPPGKEMGRILTFLYDAQLEGKFTSLEAARIFLQNERKKN